MEEIQSKLPLLFTNIVQDGWEKNWDEVRWAAEKLIWLDLNDSVSALKGYFDVVDKFACESLIRGECYSILFCNLVQNWINVVIFRERDKIKRRDLVEVVYERIQKLRFFNLAKVNLNKVNLDPDEIVSGIVDLFKKIRELLMIACMHISYKFEKRYKKTVKSYLNNTFSHEVALIVECKYSKSTQITDLVIEFSSRPAASRQPVLSKSLYYGNLVSDSREGFGRLSLQNGDKFEGFFKNDSFYGEGLYMWNKNEWFKGNFVQGLIHGRGRKRFKNGNVYEGDFFKGKMHGSGKMVFANGDFYDGEWNGDHMNGHGIYFWAKSGDRFEGFMRQDVRVNGVIVLESGEDYKV